MREIRMQMMENIIPYHRCYGYQLKLIYGSGWQQQIEIIHQERGKSLTKRVFNKLPELMIIQKFMIVYVRGGKRNQPAETLLKLGVADGKRNGFR